ncbi:DNA repair protein RadC [Fusobacterium perfoetens]|uniref:RadC family protein n=1 Tax=Fusobacterium perfoetens TaxID=852 RepID=UPI001F350E1A|nr:DNA repair protein RadC [Fusobacterium perfoetens]MCF2624855.1 DNA repair protein RadC [Fusobacterium perfoetens]
MAEDYIGHRKRLRERYIKNGYNALADYEIVELLLTFAKQRVDTKPLAKSLIKKYGTLEDILKADMKDLKEIDGIGEVTAFFLNFVGDIAACSFKDKTKKEKVSLKNKNQLIAYLRNEIGFSKNEEFKVLFLNSANEIIETEILFTGTIDKSAVYPRKILERALYHNARALVFAHNHPSGNISPSEKDIELIKEMKEFFKIADIYVLDHIIITRDSYFSFLEEGII